MLYLNKAPAVVRRLADDFDPRLVFEQGHDAFTHDALVLDDQNANGQGLCQKE